MGIQVSGTSAIVSNCVIRGCISHGIFAGTNGSNTTIMNCIITNNGGCGIITYGGSTLNVTNCIGRSNGREDYLGTNYSGGSWGPLNLSYCNGNGYQVYGSQGCINLDPQFVSTTDLHISEGSPCWDKGNPSLFDPDGSQSDMGYFGGPDCPVYPVVKSITLIPQPDGSVKIQATGTANY